MKHDDECGCIKSMTYFHIQGPNVVFCFGSHRGDLIVKTKKVRRIHKGTCTYPRVEIYSLAILRGYLSYVKLNPPVTKIYNVGSRC